MRAATNESKAPLAGLSPSPTAKRIGRGINAVGRSYRRQDGHLARRGRFPPAEHITDQITAWRVKALRFWAADPGGYTHSTSATSGKTQKEKS